MQANRIIVFLLFLSIHCLAQTDGRLPLSVILDRIADRHGIKIARIEEELSVYSLVPPDEKLSLNEKLTYIEQRTRLKFEKVNTTYYTVYNDIRMDKPLCGYLTDKETGKGIENAQITFAGTNVSVSSGADGYFTLPVLSPNTITVTHIGYKPITLSPQQLYVPECPVIPLEPNTIALQEVNAGRYLATGITKRETGEIMVKPKKFGILPGLTEPDVLQAMQQLPGISNVDETVANINVRGGTHDQNLFLWNGIRMFQTSHFFGLISAFNPLSATKVNIYKNGTPAFYGESVSSLIDISTYTPVADSCYNVIAVDMVNANFLSMIRLSEKSRIHAAGRRTYTDIFTSPTFKAYQDRVFQNTIIRDVESAEQVPVQSNDEFYFYDLALQYQYAVDDRTELFINGIGIENGVKFHQQTTASKRTSNLLQRNIGGSLSIKRKWNNSHETDGKAYLSWYDLDGTNESIENEQITHQRNYITDKGINLQHAYNATEKLNVSIGYQFNEISITNFDEVNIPSFARNEREVSRTHSLIAEGKYSPTEKTIIIAGLRTNYFEKFDKMLPEPRLRLRQSLSENLNVEIAGEQKSQTVLQIVDQQQDFLGIEKRRWTLADGNNIPMQKSKQVSLGFDYSQNGWLVTFEGFYKKNRGITTDAQGFQNQFEFTSSTGNYSVLGTEILLQKSFQRFYSWISYSYNDSKYDFGQLQPSGFPGNFTFTHALSFAGIYEYNNLNVAFGAKWHTGRPYTKVLGYLINPAEPLNAQIVYEEPNNSTLSAYFQINMSASKTWVFSRKFQLTASGSVLNILDRKNILNRYHRVNKAGNGVESINTYSLGTTPNLSVKIIF